jgi:hypothetical protein
MTTRSEFTEAGPRRVALVTGLDTAIKVNGAAPGHVATDFNGFRGTRTPRQAAVVALRLATLAADGPTGPVFQDEEQLPW